jgi:hypothetical protein
LCVVASASDQHPAVEYYYNVITNESVWEAPPELVALAAAAVGVTSRGVVNGSGSSPSVDNRKPLERSAQWEECRGPTNLPYFYNVKTNEVAVV